MGLSSPFARLRASLLLLLVAFIWGSAFVAQKTAFDSASGGEDALVAIAPLGVMTFTGIRFLLGALVVLPFMVWERHRPGEGGEGPRDPWRYLGIGGVLFTASLTQQIGILGTSVTNAGFLTAIYVPLVPVMALVFFGRTVPWVIWPGALGCLGGAWLLTGGQAEGFSALSTGDLWVLSGTLFWAAHVTVVGIVVGRARRPLSLAFGQFVACGILGLGGAALFESIRWESLMASAPEIAYAGFLSAGVAFTLQVVAQKDLHPAAVAIILSTEMVFAALAGAVALGESMSGTQVAGATLILGSILAVEVASALKAARPPREEPSR
ncbi:MAG: DMT family transporter [Rhodospirillum sp.]|nr:DMT family transporter [Rhodospirillum sp.]MCF8488339.1 DMT family transporter [Rhodospirillum sp.]MCF8502618.1 DMT family transporter [Rhodospirillum sp.]